MISFPKPMLFRSAGNSAKASRAPNIRPGGRNRIETIKEVPENVEGSAPQAREGLEVESLSSVSSSDGDSVHSQGT